MSNDSSSDSEDEDDEGILASGELDAQIQATLQAIRGKDPRVYDEKARFYTDFEDEHPATLISSPQVKPMYLTDYHRENLLAGVGVADADNEDKSSRTYVQQQDDLRQSVIKEMHHASVMDNNSSEGKDSPTNQGYGDDGDSFLVKKLPELRTADADTSANQIALKSDPQTAEKDPEAFLSNFMSTRAWIAPPGSKMQPFESDDDEDERRAENFEEAYNLRFEDPQGSNEKLLSHARDAVAKYSVRKEQSNSRKKVRESERAKKEAERCEREEDKARLRKLRIADAEEKIRKIKDAAGLRSGALDEKPWAKFMDEFWDDHRWEEEMKKRFGDEYYADHDAEDGHATGNGKNSVRKPKWHDDIDIQDIVPDFEAEGTQNPPFSLTNDDLGSEVPLVQQSDDISDESLEIPESGVKKTLKKERVDQRKYARQQRRRIEEIVDQRLNADITLTSLGPKHEGLFRYRETSPLAYGLTAHDILMATDSQLNQYAGLKKLAAFRDTEKKKKDKKHFGKKARLRQWRKETFGDENGPQNTQGGVVETPVLRHAFPAPSEYEETDVSRPKKKSRSRKKGKSTRLESTTQKAIK